MLKVDAKNRRVDLTQRSEEERAADKALTEQGARSVRVAGLNSMGAALARAGIRKQDFEDLSKVWTLVFNPQQSRAHTGCHLTSMYLSWQSTREALRRCIEFLCWSGNAQLCCKAQFEYHFKQGLCKVV